MEQIEKKNIYVTIIATIKNGRLDILKRKEIHLTKL